MKSKQTFDYRLKALAKSNEYHRKRELVMRFRKEDKLLAQVLHRQGWSLERIALKLRVSRKQVWKWVKANLP